MHKGPRFLRHSEWAEFQKPGRFVARYAALPRDGKVVPVSSKPEELLPALRKDLEARKDGQIWFRCWSISVGADDGMSWTAESISQELSKARPHFHQDCIPAAPTVNRLPAIARIVGEKNFLRLAARHRLTTSFLTLRSWLTPAIIGSAFALALTLRIIEVLFKAKSPDAAAHLPSALLNTSFWAIAAAASGLGLISQYVSTLFTTRTRAKSMEKFLSDLPEKQETQEYNAFIEDLASQLRSSDFPRFVIIDHFERLDLTTQRVVDRYLAQYSEQARGSEFWVILELQEQKTFSSLRALSQKGYGYSRTRQARQVALERAEKQALKDLLGLEQEAVEFHSVKRVCERVTVAGTRHAVLFREYREHHPADPEHYGVLDVLHLLGLTSVPGHVSLPDTFVRDRFSPKSGVVAGLLAQVLPGTTLTKPEFEKRILNLRESFGSVLVEERPEASSSEGGTLARFGAQELTLRVSPEAAEALQGIAEELALRPAGLGHLFWAVFWHDALAKRPMEAVWIQKLAHHVIEADGSLAKDGKAANGRLIEAAMFTLRGCFRCSVLPPLVPLLQQTALLLDAPADIDPAPLRKALAEIAWGAYMVLGDENARRVFLDLAKIVSTPAPVPAVIKDSHRVAAGLEPQLQEFLVASAPEVWATPCAEQLRLRGMWLSLTLYPLLSRSARSLLWQAVVESYGDMDRIQERTHRRVSSLAAEPLRSGEMLNLSLALWCSGLQVRLGFDASLSAAESALAAAGDEAPAIIPDTLAAYPRYLKLIEFATDSLALVAPNPVRMPSGVNFTGDGLVRDVAVSAAAAVLVGRQLLHRNHKIELPPDVQQRVNHVLSTATAILDNGAPSRSQPGTDSADANSRVENLMNICTMMWHAFGMDQMRHFMTVRRAHFNALCREAPVDRADRLLLESEGSIIDRQDFVGLIANCVAADSLAEAGELSAFYLRRSALITADGSVGNGLRLEFARLAIDHGHALGLDLSRFVKAFIEGRPEECPLADELADTSTGDLAGVALRYLNASQSAGSGMLSASVNSCILAHIESRGGGPALDELRELLDLFRIDDARRSGQPVDVEAELERWKARTGSWMYPFLLTKLLSVGSSGRLRGESFHLIDHDALLDQSNCCLLLASVLAHDFDDGQSANARIVRNYLKDGIKKWEGRLQAEKNVEIYEALVRLDPANTAHYNREWGNWTQTKLHRDHLRRFPELLDQRRFFVIFSDYFRTIQSKGLETDLERNQLRARPRAEPAERRATVARWKQQGAKRPPAMIFVGRRAVVSSEFLVLGTYLFDEPLADDVDWAEDREHFNNEAERNLFQLLSLIVTLPDLPGSIKDILRLHAGRLYNYSLPDITEAVMTRSAAS